MPAALRTTHQVNGELFLLRSLTLASGRTKHIQLHLAWIMPPYPTLSVTHEVFDEDEEPEASWVIRSDTSGNNVIEARRLNTACEGGRLSGPFIPSTITRVSPFRQAFIPWIWTPATDYPSTLQSRPFSITIRCAKRQSLPDRQSKEK